MGNALHTKQGALATMFDGEDPCGLAALRVQSGSSHATTKLKLLLLNEARIAKQSMLFVFHPHPFFLIN
jgi:hypothetical protein